MKEDTEGNILMVSNYASNTVYAWWLMEHFWCLLGGTFAEAGRKAYLAYPQVKSVPKSIQESAIEVVEMALPWSDARGKAQVKQFIEDNKITALYFTDQPYFNWKYAQLREWGIEKIVVHDHTPGDRPAIGGWKGWIKSLRNQINEYCADGVLCVSELMRDRSIKNGKVPEGKCHVVQNGIPPVPSLDGSKDQLRRQLGIPEDSFVVITTGRAHPYKRFDFVIESADLLRTQRPDLSVLFLLAGDGPAMHELESQVAERHLGEVVRLLGFRRDIQQLLHASDAALHAALGEGFSLSIVEYMSAGLPVLVPNIPSVCQAIDHGDNGFVYKWDSCESLAEGISRLVQDEKLTDEMGARAKRKANSLYTLDRCSEQLLQTVRRILELEDGAVSNIEPTTPAWQDNNA